MVKSVDSEPKNIVVVGSSGAIGNAFTELLANKFPKSRLHAFSRQSKPPINYKDENSIVEAATYTEKYGQIDLMIIVNGILHDGKFMPEKSLKDLSSEKFHHLFEVNTITPALIAKHFLPRMNRQGCVRIAMLSARVGSISDNQLGGWYAYRASKAALNMIIKNAAIEIGRRNRRSIIVGLHPGTVDSNLSRPFQRNIPDEKLFSPNYSAQKLLEVLMNLNPSDSGKCFAWDGQEIPP